MLRPRSTRLGSCETTIRMSGWRYGYLMGDDLRGAFGMYIAWQHSR